MKIENGTRTTVAQGVSAAVAAVLLAGCGAQAVAPAVDTAASLSAADPAVASQEGYTASTRRVTEQVGATAVDVVLPELTGGDPAVTDRINEQIADKLTAWAGQGERGAGEFTLTGEGSEITHIGASVVSARSEAYLDTVPPGASPTNLLEGDAWRLDTGERIGILDVFRDGDLRGLATSAREALEADPDRQGVPLDAAGLEPVEENFDQFTVDPSGITILFDEYQLGGNGNATATVRWNDLRGTLAPELVDVVTS